MVLKEVGSIQETTDDSSASLYHTISAIMTTDDRDQMMELCRRIHRETDPKRLAIYALELNQFIQRKLDELKSKAQ